MKIASPLLNPFFVSIVLTEGDNNTYFDAHILLDAYGATNPTDEQLKLVADFVVNIVPLQCYSPSKTAKCFNGWDARSDYTEYFLDIDEGFALVVLVNDKNKINAMVETGYRNEKEFISKAPADVIQAACPPYNKVYGLNKKTNAPQFISLKKEDTDYGGWNKAGARRWKELTILVNEFRDRVQQQQLLRGRFRIALGTSVFEFTGGKAGYNTTLNHWVLGAPQVAAAAAAAAGEESEEDLPMRL